MHNETLLSIKEFSDFANVAQSTLRYYDEIGLLRPAMRGANNYRYYTPFQLFKLNYINILVDLGTPLATIKEMDLNRTPESIIELLDHQEVVLNRRLNEIQTAYAILHTYRKSIQQGISVESGLIRIEELDEIPYALGLPNELQEHETFYDTFIRFCKSAATYRIDLRYPTGGYYNEMNRFLANPKDPDHFYSVDPLGSKIRPRGKYLVAYHRGYYGEFGDTPQRMKAFADEHGIVCKGSVAIVYLLDEVTIADGSNYLAQISVAIE